MADIKMIKGTNKLSEEELSQISGGAKVVEDGKEYVYPDLCPVCKKPIDLNDKVNHVVYFNPDTYKAFSIICRNSPDNVTVQEFFRM